MRSRPFFFILAFGLALHAAALRAEVGKDEEDLSQSIAEQTELLKDRVKSFQHIVIDVRGSRGGKGDVAAGYLTALDLMNRAQFAGKITLITDETSRKILAKLQGKKVNSGDPLLTDKVVVMDLNDLPNDYATADMYLSLANPSGRLRYSFDFVQEGQMIPRGTHKIRTRADTVFITQTVLGNTENADSSHPLGELKIRDNVYDLNPAGIGGKESGFYLDAVAVRLRGKTLDQVHASVLESLNALPSRSSERQLVEQILTGKKLAGGKVGLAYGITSAMVKQQFSRYLQGLYAEAVEKKKSFVLLTPSGFSQKDAPGVETVVIDSPSDLPKVAEPGTIYIVKTGALPHEVFVGLMAYSAVPPVVAGDGAMSAAITLGKPFVMTEVKWNYKNIRNLNALLQQKATSPQEKLLYARLYGQEGASWGSTVDLTRSLELQKYPNRFESLARELPKLTDRLFEAASLGKGLPPNATAEDIVARIQDPALRLPFLYKWAEEGNLEATRLLKAWALANPSIAYRRMLMGKIKVWYPLEPLLLDGIKKQILSSNLQYIDEIELWSTVARVPDRKQNPSASVNREQLLKLLFQSKHTKLLGKCLMEARIIGMKEALLYAHQALGDENPYNVKLALELIRSLEGERSLSTMLKMTQNPNAVISETAFANIANLPKEISTPVLFQIIDALKAPNPTAQDISRAVSAAKGILRFEDKAVIQKILPGLDSC